MKLKYFQKGNGVEENGSNKRDILIVIGLFILLIALVVVADMRAKTYQEVLVAGNSAAQVDGQGDSTSSGKGDKSINAVRYNNTLDFFKMVFLITFIFILFIALVTTMIILVIRVIQRRLSKAPPGA